MVMAVREMECQLVKPTQPPPYPLPSLPFSKLDLVIANIYVKTVFFFKHKQRTLDFFSSHVLLRSLRQALSLFYPFAGALSPPLHIDCNGQGALFVEALADCTLDDLGGDFTPDPDLLQLVPTLQSTLTSHPLLLIQVTKFECGGVALGMALEHHAGDGVSALNFLKTWCSLARGETFTMSPSFDKAWLSARTPPTPKFAHDEYLKLPQPVSKESLNPYVYADQEPIVRMFDLPREFLQKLKLTGAAGALSTYEMLAAHVWRCCCQARMLSNNDESMLIMAVDGRTRLKGMKNPQNYVGNVIFNTCLSLSVGEIKRLSVASLATKIHTTIRKVDNEYCKSAIDFLETKSQAELASYVKGPHTFANPNFGFISWTRFPFYEIDFGWGSADHVGPAHVPWEGHAYLLASPSSAHLRLCINLQRLHMHKFAHLLLDSS